MDKNSRIVLADPYNPYGLPHCIDLSEYKKLHTVSEKVYWLSKYGKAVCAEELYVNIIRDHQITAPVILNSAIVPLECTWEVLSNLISHVVAYEEYLWVIKDSGTFRLEVNREYDQMETCYSIPFIRSIAKKCSLSSIDPVTVMYAEVNHDNLILFKITNRTTGNTEYYDFSNEPKLIDPPNRPL